MNSNLYKKQSQRRYGLGNFNTSPYNSRKIHSQNNDNESVQNDELISTFPPCDMRLSVKWGQLSARTFSVNVSNHHMTKSLFLCVQQTKIIHSEIEPYFYN